MTEEQEPQEAQPSIPEESTPENPDAAPPEAPIEPEPPAEAPAQEPPSEDMKEDAPPPESSEETSPPAEEPSPPAEESTPTKEAPAPAAEATPSEETSVEAPSEAIDEVTEAPQEVPSEEPTTKSQEQIPEFEAPSEPLETIAEEPAMERSTSEGLGLQTSSELPTIEEVDESAASESVTEEGSVDARPLEKQTKDEDDFDIVLSQPEEESGAIAFDEVDVSEEGSVEEEEEKVKKKKHKRRAPAPKLRRSLQSDDIRVQPRFRGEKERGITGDFTKDETQSLHLSEREDLGEEEESGEEESEEEGPPKPTIDRDMYYEMYAHYDKQLQREKFKNNFLQKKLGDYYRKRRMEHALKDTDGQFETEKKYELQLDQLEQLHETAANEELRMNMEIADLRSIRDKKREQIALLFKTMQDAEMQLGKELFTSEEGKANVDKIVDRMLKHQKQQLSQVIKMRLNYIKMRNKLSEKQDALNALDNLGPNLHLIDYEQLKFDNRNLQDKLEERENELLKLRLKCQNAMQMLAHRREKAAAIDEDMEVLKERLEEVSLEYEDAREQLNEVKQNRDSLRNGINKMNDDAGLLTRKLLLKDMEAAMKETEVISAKVEDCKVEYEKTTGQVNNLRKNLNSNSKMEFFKHQAKGSFIDFPDAGKFSDEVSF